MAGLYPDVPGHRFAYDVDGTLIRYRYYNDTFATPPASAGPAINDEDGGDYIEFGNLSSGHNFFTGGATSGHFVMFIFPQVRDVVAYWMFATVQAISVTTHRSDVVQTSINTTDGSDGTWTTRVSANFPYSTALSPGQRTAIQPISGATGIKGIRFGVGKDNTSMSSNDWFRLYALHLYGSLVGSNNGVRFWHTTLDQSLDKAAFDFGDLAQGVVAAKTFRLKNTSSETANSIVVSAESMAGSDALLANGMAFSADGTTYTSSITITSLTAGQISPVLYARRTVGGSEAAAIRAARVKAIVGSWT